MGENNIKNYIIGGLVGLCLGITISVPFVDYLVRPIEIHMLDYDGDGKIDHCRIKTKRGYIDHRINIEYREIDEFLEDHNNLPTNDKKYLKT